MNGESVCFICRKDLPPKEIPLRLRMTSSRDGFATWRINCGASLCQLLFGSVPLPFHHHFKKEGYCADCLQIIRDVDFTVQQMKSVENRIEKLFSKIKGHLFANYNCIEEKTSAGVLEERITAVLTSTDDKKEYLNEYSYDEIVEIVHEATMKRAKYLWKNPVLTPRNERKDDGEVPFTIKMEFEEEESGDSFDVVGKVYQQSITSEWEEKRNESECFSLNEHSFQMHCNSNESKSDTFPKRQKRVKEVKGTYNEIESGEDELESNDKVKLETYSRSDESSNDNYEMSLNASKKALEIMPKSKRRKECNQNKIQNQSKVKCPVCNKIFAAQSIDYHRKTHTGEKSFRCSECGKKFTGKSDLVRHMRLSHGKIDPSGKKGKIATAAASVQNEFVTRKRLYHCDLCSWTYNMKYRYLRHLKDDHLNKDVKNEDIFSFHYCDAVDCLNSYTNLDSLRKHLFEAHLASDESKSIPECQKCQKPFLCPSNLEAHEKCHKNDRFGCKYCNSEISSQEELEHHLPRHEIVFNESLFCHLCEECGEGFTSFSMLRKHITNIHERSDKVRPLQFDKVVGQKRTKKPMKEKSKCSICHRQFLKTRLQPHILSHTQAEDFHCSHCAAKYISPSLLEAHIIRFHPPDQNNLPKIFHGRQIYCNICNKDCKQTSQFRKHVVRHHPEEYQSTHPHVCQFCWCVFEGEEERNSHIENSHNTNVCSFAGCGKRFTTKVYLETHLNVHNKVKPYICPYCQKGFSSNGNCYSHIHMVHTKHRSLRCKLCPENSGYYVKKEFTKHVEKTHPEMPMDQYSSILIHQKPLEMIKIEKINAKFGS